MPDIWKITHLVGPTKQDTTLEYTNCTELKELYQDLFPKIVNEDEEKGKGDDRCVLIPVNDVNKYKYMYGKPGDLREFPGLICPKDAWITPRLLSEMVKVHEDWLGEDDSEDEILEANGKGQEIGEEEERQRDYVHCT
ncbi:uncharacterized protein J4E79_000857 [Alternaria viburni]|uniref:uncharacterized protein n=1 Tax=Alternaria viburni TaxID=566460 RepID=UPI0020C44BDB|nr:uncharacterized protein J4E79_000857 [Alternaria viburni]KAI4670572.1 hypothetical protein J4E79_000857 [Alternaria viburni]